MCCWPLNYIGFTHLGSKQEKCWILGVRQLDSAGAVAVPASYSLMLSVKHSVSPSSTTVFSKTRVLSLSRHHVSVPYCGGYSATTLHRITCLNKTKFRQSYLFRTGSSGKSSGNRAWTRQMGQVLECCLSHVLMHCKNRKMVRKQSLV